MSSKRADKNLSAPFFQINSILAASEISRDFRKIGKAIPKNSGLFFLNCLLLSQTLFLFFQMQLSELTNLLSFK